jgi:murein DD-endopeptidase MepM/ murein hydrolase activator NlpD
MQRHARDISLGIENLANGAYSMKIPSITIIVCAVAMAMLHTAAASSLSVKLPYAKGERFVVSQGYDAPPTHIKKDSYALDLTQNRCDAYGKAVVAAASGKVMFSSQEGYNGGYGTELIIDHGAHIVSRYAHMIPESITAGAIGSIIRQGQTVGLVGDTGLVAGMACVAHPGAHIHFAMDTVNADGTFSPYNPEPISGYTNMTQNVWYLSDNGDDDGVAATGSAVPVGGVAVISIGAASSPSPPPPLESDATSTDDATNTFIATTSVATTTVVVATDTIETAASSTPTSSPVALITTPATGTLFTQLDDDTNSPGSWYDDNWFELGNGFSGTLTALTLQGKINDRSYFASHISLQEFRDKNYTVMIQEFPISNDAPFTSAIASTTFDGLSIPLKPYFYYRLTTLEDWQNRSVILAGTATTTTGVAMWNNFIYGAGRVEYTTPFFPFMIMEGVAATSSPVPPPLTTPAYLTTSLDQLTMQLDLSFGTSTDPDWPANPLHYQMNYSTATALSDDRWVTPTPIPVATGSVYLVGVRAVDNYGDVSGVATATWNLPPGFAPYLLSPGLGYAYQYFTVPSTSTLRSIEIFTANFGTSAANPDTAGCGLQLFDENNSSSLGMTQSDNSFNGYACAGGLVFSFASSSPIVYPGHRYHWIYTVSTGNPTSAAGVQFYGTAIDTAGGSFSDPSLANAKFVLTGDAGVLFGN